MICKRNLRLFYIFHVFVFFASEMESTLCSSTELFVNVFDNKYLSSSRIQTYKVNLLSECAIKCIQNTQCKSYNIKMTTWPMLCDLLSKNRFDVNVETDYEDGEGWSHYDTVLPICFNEEIRLRRNTLFTTLHTVGKQWMVMFDLKLTESRSYWQSVLHFTVGGNRKNYGDRIPAIFTNLGIIYIISSVNGDVNYTFKVKEVFPLNTWVNIKISQMKVMGNYIYQILINGEEVLSTQNDAMQVFHDVKVFAGDNWYEAQPGSIRNLCISNIIV